ncbi:MAG TPA: hypothetical protein VFW66_07285 [Gemmatimonadales bacterium]|nr:hypothetical protein [Gemmatimonadales bacterium]
MSADTAAPEPPERAPHLWEKVVDKVQALQLRMRDEAERRRVNQVLGRPVSRTILDDRQRVILDFGEPVTRAAVLRARRCGVLDALLSAVGSPDGE